MKTTPKIKAQAYGLKFDGKLVKCYVSYGTMRDGSKQFTIYANDYGIRLPQVEGWENDTDSMTDYFDKDKIRVSRQSPFYRAWVGELRRKRNIDRARFRAQQNKRQAKWAARRGETFTPKNPFAVWLEKHMHYKAAIAAKEAREAVARANAVQQARTFCKIDTKGFAGTQAETLARMVFEARAAVETYRKNTPPVLVVLPKPAACSPAAFTVARVRPECAPAAWAFATVQGVG